MASVTEKLNFKLNLIEIEIDTCGSCLPYWIEQIQNIFITAGSSNGHFSSRGYKILPE